jgi:hypothetical protein
MRLAGGWTLIIGENFPYQLRNLQGYSKSLSFLNKKRLEQDGPYTRPTKYQSMRMSRFE